MIQFWIAVQSGVSAGKFVVVGGLLAGSSFPVSVAGFERANDELVIWRIDLGFMRHKLRDMRNMSEGWEDLLP